MRIPKSGMSRHELIQWIYEHDFNRYAELYLEENSRAFGKQSEEMLNEEVYDLIWDEVYYGNEYLDYILYEES